jgi:Uma2 family endonuclease
MIRAGIFGPEERLELVEGEIVEMSPQDPPHSVGVQLVGEELRREFPAGFHVRAQLPMALSDDSEPEPDLAVVRGDIRDYVAEHPATAVLVVEVAYSTLVFDRRRKARIYARAGIPDYWIVNVPRRVLEVYREPRPDGTYAQVRRFGESDSVSPLAQPDAQIRVSALLP